MASAFSGDDSSKASRVYVGNLAWSVSDDALADVMSEAGNVVEARVLRYESGRSKGCAVVTFATPDDAARAIQELKDREIDGRLIFVREDREAPGSTGSGGRGGRGPRRGGGRGGGGDDSGPRRGGRGRGGPSPAAAAPRSAPRSGPPSEPAIFVGNLPFATTEDELYTEFDRYNPVSVSLPLGSDGRPRGFAIVKFGTMDNAQAAINEMNGRDIGGRRALVKWDEGPRGGR